MNRVILISLLAIFLLSIGCNKDNKCGENSGYTTNCIPPEILSKHKKSSDNIVHRSQDGADSSTLTSGYALIGQSLLAYPELESVEDDFDEAMFADNQNRLDELVLPIYEITTDHDAVNKLIDALRQDRSVTADHGGNEEDNVFKIDSIRFKVNKETGRVRYIDLEKDHQGPEVDKIDKKLMLQKAEDIFKHYVPEDLLKNTYFYRYVVYANSSFVRGGEVVTKPYAAAVALNPVVNDYPIIGSGGKYSVHVESDGSVSSFDLQLSRFIETDHRVKIMDSTEAMKELENRLSDDGVSLDDHVIKSSKFGYNFQSKRGKVKWLVPSYSFVVVPKEGVMDVGRIYTFSASFDPIAQQLFDEDITSEMVRKAKLIDEESVQLSTKD